jgi:hypothetical protein
VQLEQQVLSAGYQQPIGINSKEQLQQQAGDC